MKIKFKSTLFFYTNVLKKLPITLFFGMDLNFLYSSKVLDKEKISVQKLFNTANQNNSVINRYLQLLSFS